MYDSLMTLSVHIIEIMDSDQLIHLTQLENNLWQKSIAILHNTKVFFHISNYVEMNTPRICADLCFVHDVTSELVIPFSYKDFFSTGIIERLVNFAI